MKIQNSLLLLSGCLLMGMCGFVKKKKVAKPDIVVHSFNRDIPTFVCNYKDTIIFPDRVKIYNKYVVLLFINDKRVLAFEDTGDFNADTLNNIIINYLDKLSEESIGNYIIERNKVTVNDRKLFIISNGRLGDPACVFEGIYSKDSIANWQMIEPFPKKAAKYDKHTFTELTTPRTLHRIPYDNPLNLDSLFRAKGLVE